MTKRIIVVDDEQAARLKLRQLLNLMPEWQLVAEVNSGDALFAALTRMEVDIILLDINMPGMNGVHILQALNQRNFSGEVIFTTAHAEHAIAAFDAAAADYVLKPIAATRLKLALDRAEQKRAAKQLSESQQELLSQVGQRTRTVKVELIDAIVTSNGIQEAHCGAHRYPLDFTLRDLQLQLPNHFLRVHRGAIINRFRLTEVERWLNGRLLLRFVQSNLEVLTSRTGARELKRYLQL